MRKSKAVYRFIILTLVGLGFFLTGCARVQTKAEPFTLIVLPDTQNYTDSSFGGKPDYFYDQTRWIKDNKDKLNIVMVAHEGDIVQHPQAVAEWEVVDTAFKTIDNDVPYILCLGNHDIAADQDAGPSARDTLLNDYFAPSRFTNNPLYNKNFGPEKSSHFREAGKSDNYYLLFAGAGMKFMIISLEFQPRDEVLTWANEVVTEHPNHRCILLTHAYLDESGKLNYGGYGVKGNKPQEIWDKFVSRHKNIFLALCGHILGESFLTSVGNNANNVHQVLANYQNDYIRNGGNGYLRIMTFIPEEDKIEVQTYSPSLDNYLDRPKSRFSLEYRMGKQARAAKIKN